MQNIDPRMDALIDAYIDHSIDDAQFEMLCAWLREDATHRQMFARRLSTHSAISEWCTERSGSVLAKGLTAAQNDPDQAEASSWIDELSGLNEQAEATTPRITSVAAYALRQALTSRPAYQAYGAAAMLLLGVTLFFVFTGNDGEMNPTPDLTATPNDRTNQPGPVGPAPSNAVATLTAEHDAIWDRHPGDDLYAGQRFALTQGFAEITTSRGAVAIVEAPATIELLDSENAIRLHAGKLVGICETESSKGFVVRTPTMDVIDLGTRFGVAVDPNARVQVGVFDGEVQVMTNDGSDLTRHLKRDESITFDTEAQSFVELQDAVSGTSAFSALTSITSGITKRSNNIRVMPTRPNTLGTGRFISDTDIFVFPELAGVTLPDDVAVNHTKPGRYDKFLPNNVGAHAIPAGTVVRSYVIHVDSAGPDLPGTAYQGSITFNGPILGVMTQRNDWASFNTLLPNESIQIAVAGDEVQADDLLEGTDFKSSTGRPLAEFGKPDWLELEPDGLTLTFQLAVQEGSDQVRVLVAEPAVNSPVANPSR